jgi:hypothetical protein
MAFGKSFGNQKNALKAIADRGWNPLNYNILATYKHFEKDAIDLTLDTSTTNKMTIPTVNIGQGAGSFYLDWLIEEENKSEARKRKLKKSSKRSRRQRR